MFQEENPGDCDALTHLSPQCVILAPAAEGRERGRSLCRRVSCRVVPHPPPLTRSGLPPGRFNKSSDFHGRRQTRGAQRAVGGGGRQGLACSQNGLFWGTPVTGGRIVSPFRPQERCSVFSPKYSAYGLWGSEPAGRNTDFEEEMI